MGLFCNVQHPSGHGMTLSQSWASAAESVSHSSFQSFPSMSCAQLGTAFAFVDILHAWMWNCSPAQGRENLLGAPIAIPPLQLLCPVGGGKLGPGAHSGDTDNPPVPPVKLDWDGHGKVPAPRPLPPSASLGGF